MSYSSLSLELQNILLVQHQYISKWFLFFVFSFLSAYYLFGILPCQKKTSSILTVLLRIVYFTSSVGYLFSIPLQFILLSPETNLWSMYSVPLSLYLLFASIFLLVFIIGLLKTGLMGMLNYIGVDTGDTEVKKQIENIKHAFGGFK